MEGKTEGDALAYAVLRKQRYKRSGRRGSATSVRNLIPRITSAPQRASSSWSLLMARGTRSATMSPTWRYPWAC
jgi:hypothetical protein